MSQKIYPTLTAIPRVNVGDAMFRRTLVNRYEEAIVVSIMSAEPDSESWSATLMTKNGIEHVSGHVETRSIHDWMPKGWVYDAKRVGWVPPAALLRDDSKEVVLEDPVEAEKISRTQLLEIPTPWVDEKYMSWRSRVLKSQPTLKGTAAVYDKLSSAWKEKQYEISI
jgi:hypothetical protein|tara:strand:- start:683 stop:1183 length:501 start_codon:yes stop_codon:yes gene_type:complete